MDKNELLKYYFGYNDFRPGQDKVIDNVMLNKDTIGIFPTGFGKSVCFVIPALMLDGITIVITPLISLMHDQVKNLKRKGIPALEINSLLSYDQMNISYQKILKNKIKLIFISGERLLNDKFKFIIKNLKISLIVIDEAHTLLWGEDFRLALKNIPLFYNYIGYKPTILSLTATCTNTTLNKIIKYLNLDNPNIFRVNPDRKNIFYNIIKTNDKFKTLINILNRHKNEKIIIYCLTIKNFLNLYNKLNKMNYNITYYHGELSNEEKKQNQEDFSSINKDIIVATNSFGMGIDISNIRYVLCYDMPGSIEDLTQQLGRAGRDGKYSIGTLFFNLKDIEINKYFIEHINVKNKEEIKKDRYKKLDSIIKLCLKNKCIHQQINEYFGYKDNNKCKNMCSCCIKK